MRVRLERGGRQGRRLAGLACVFCFVALALGAPALVAEESLVIFLVRHAEKLEAEDDPELSPAGVERAAALAALLHDSGIERVHSSDYARSRDTAAPVAAALGLEVELYDAFDLPALAAKLRQEEGRHLVVGHSNTTPEMVTLLGGEPGSEIDEEGEYDRLYVVTVAGDEVSTLLLRYGEVWSGNAP